MISQILDGRIKAHMVTIPMISKISPNSSTSPGLWQHFFLFIMKSLPYLI